MDALIMFILLSFLCAAEPSRVIDRFGGQYRKDLRCRIGLPEKMESSMSLYNGLYPKVDLLNEFFFDFFRKPNCSIAPAPFTEFGTPLANGSYTGAIGFIQRQEVEIYHIGVRPDALPFEPGIIGPVLMENDQTIISRKNYSKPIEREIASFVEDFDEVSYAFFQIVMTLFCIIYTAARFIFHGQVVQVSLETLYNLLDTINEVIASIFDQMNLSPSRGSLRILAASLGLFVFVVIYGIVANDIGSNLVINRTPPQIDSLEYFFSNTSWTVPVIIKKLFLYPLLKISIPGTNLGHLWQAIKSNPNESIWDIDFYKGQEENVQKGMELFTSINNCSKALITSRLAINVASKIGCIVRPDLFTDVNVAKESFAEGYLAPLFSHGMHSYLRKVMEYYWRTLHEFALVQGALETFDSAIPDIIPSMKFGKQSLDCQAVKSSKPKQEEWRAFTVLDLRTTFKILLIGIGGGGIICILEWIVILRRLLVRRILQKSVLI